MLLSDYGIEYYNTVLFTTEKMAKEKPEVVQKFLAATLQGITDVVADPNQAVDFTLSYGKDLKRDVQAAALQAMIPLINPPGSKPGSMDASIWRASYQMGVDEHMVDTSLDVSSAYTLNFLNKIYQ
jgi:NitT/TauT family transport system substrate-binding protein